jgi:ABC-type multidrug transport system ATPase subunit
MPNTRSNAIELKALTKIYHSAQGEPVTAINNLNLTIPRGQVFGIFGVSGSGKTTLVKLIGGLIPPTSGDIRLNGYPLVPEYDMALTQVGVVQEGTQDISRCASVWQNLEHALTLRASSNEMLPQQVERIKELLLEVGLWPERDKALSELPRGRQRLVAFSCAVLNNPPILIFDEPISGLDFQAVERFNSWITNLAHEQGKTVVLTTRSPTIARDLCDYIVVLKNGQVAAILGASDMRSPSTDCYQIRVKGYLDSCWREWFNNLDIINTTYGETVISGPIPDQAALYGMLIKIRNLALPLLSVTRLEPDLTTILGTLTNEQLELKQK